MKLVTGGTGRIGNVLVRELNKRYGKVKVLVREKSDLKALKDCDCEFIKGDILDPESLKKAFENVDTVFHLAAFINISDYNKDLTLNTNIEGTKNIANLCLINKIPLIYTSSIHAINAPEDGSVISESTQLAVNYEKRRELYDYSKATATNYILECMKKGLKAIIVHPTGVLGPFDYKPSSFGQGMISLIKSGLKTTISGSYYYVDVRDVVEAILKLYELEKYGERYILSGHIMDMEDYVAYLKEVTGINGKTGFLSKAFSLFIGAIVSFFNRKAQITPYSVSTLHSNCNISHDKATKDFGYSPRDVRASVHDQFIWFSDNG